MTVTNTATLEETAERIAGFSLVAYHDNPDAVRAQLKADVLSALRNERERAAQLCDKEVAEWVVTARNYSALDPMRNTCLSRAEEAEELAKAIRERD